LDSSRTVHIIFLYDKPVVRSMALPGLKG